MTFGIKKFAASAVVALAAGGAHAAMQTLDGVGFDITYDDAALGLFGSPSLIDNSLFFAPSGSPGFSAQTASGFAFTNSTFAFQISADPGYVLTAFTLVEEGDYFYFGEGSGVDVGGQLRVKPLVPLAESMTSAIEADTGIMNTTLSIATHNWSSMSVVETAGIEKANVSIENLLAAYSYTTSGPSYAFIEKKGVELAVGVAAVPEPESYALMLAGIGMIGMAARRRMNRM
ncbi:PEP-CTERM sorting domain-containing protein [Cognatazoarcus halotolerans]|uniref:PEP-CTERM sorting domain-containing protein n=1 Tax=Cognatazoarcus halotolerans TaxID=2686016 RepID=UPI001358452B|nr:PEP-CTERM sorting domain-containing protein [Cognatazoarcus halotolerans]MBX3680377.1 PEP-CTERM sorting domain-containing protein [Rhodocyclaceae bacterium]MCB1898620.1 PEP-CTERM sorting domain-containing protein [Rhodocyclaceae bacterium]MCP5310853.1 PEP-CTERM sorting domain-containing protein [Zoogloeaceae bacterium]